MIVVADTGPTHYLVLIAAADLLQPLYTRAVVPQTVAEELNDNRTPNAVRTWIAQPRGGVRYGRIPPSDPWTFSIAANAAITLAKSIAADRLLIDD